MLKIQSHYSNCKSWAIGLFKYFRFNYKYWKRLSNWNERRPKVGFKRL